MHLFVKTHKGHIKDTFHFLFSNAIIYCRYGTRLKIDNIKPHQIPHLYDTGDQPNSPVIMEIEPESTKHYTRKRSHRCKYLQTFNMQLYNI